MAKKETGQLYKESLLDIFNRANTIASMTSLGDLLDQMLDLIIEVAAAQAGTLYLHEPETKELVFHVVKGDESAKKLVGQRMGQEDGLAGAAFTSCEPLLIDDLESDPRWNKKYHPDDKLRYENMLALPLLLAGKPIGVVQLFNFDEIEIEMLLLLANRMASEVDKAAMIAESRKHSARLETLLEVIRALGSTLDRNQILKEIVFRGRELLDVEACSIFLIDPKSGDTHFYTTTQTLGKEGVGIYVPKEEGIVGEVIKTGESVIVHDVREHSKHYKVVDEITGFHTKSLLAAPLKAEPINLGAGKGRSKARTLGVIQALNKNQRTFNQADLDLLESLALQAATVLHIAELYSDAKELFMGLIEALGEAIDAKDPYTQNHSKRVATVSAAIGMEMGLSIELQNTLYVGGILHDLGKIGVPDSILTKAGKLEDEEYEQIKEHPAVGKRILKNVRLLEKEIFALAEHHERLDGTGYPQGLSKDEISLVGRIVAVADVFDALICDRPYRPAMSLEEVITYLRKDARVGLDTECVEALAGLCQRGEIYTGG